MISGPIATIDLAAVADNFRSLQAMCGSAQIAATVKADAYGLGMLAVTKKLYVAGCRNFYVAHYSEAVTLRAQLPDAAIFVLHGIPEHFEKDAAAQTITGCILDLGALERMQRAARNLGKRIPINLHVDTGMNRTGFCQREWQKLLDDTSLLEGLDAQWIMSHFACSDESEHLMNETQRIHFMTATKHFATARKSLCNSHGIFLGQQMHFDQVRPGRALYGTDGLKGLKNAISLHAPIIQLRSIDSDGTVGYGATHHVRKGARLAALAYGYADGLPRSFSNNDQAMRHYFYLHGIQVPVMGRVSMDLVVVDVSKVPENLVHVGGMVEIAGTHQTVDQWAAQIDTIGYELMTHLGQRIERRYSDTQP